MNNSVFAAAALFLFAMTAQAADVPAKNCEIFMKTLVGENTSHGGTRIGVTLKVGWIGNGESVQRVAAHYRVTARDLGNKPSCNATPPSHNWQTVDAGPGSVVGESKMYFNIDPGSVYSGCLGYQLSHEVVFFVKTNKNTYWLNPATGGDSTFVLNRKAFESIATKGALQPVSTARDDMRYYNPGNCR